MIRRAIVAVAVSLAVPMASMAQEARHIFEVEIDASVEDIWNAFTTSEGLQSWVAPLADVDLRVGGKWRANYNSDGQLGDETTIENTILCFDPKHMIALKATRFPIGFEFESAAKDTWSIFYFSPVSDNRTKITIVGLGYNESEESQRMLAFFEPANKHSMEQLRAAMRKRTEATAK
jgi:uncharacterized protein YndB with AHSA1/START domain